MRSFGPGLVIAGVLATVGTGVFADPVLNPGFETGDLSGWTYSGSPPQGDATAFGQAVKPSLQGGYSALLVATGSANCTLDRWTTGCASGATVPPIPYASAASQAPIANQAVANSTFRWAMLAQQLDLNATDRISFQMQVLGEASLNALDSVFVTLLSKDAQGNTIGDVWCNSDLGFGLGRGPCAVQSPLSDPLLHWHAGYLPAVSNETPIPASVLGFDFASRVYDWNIGARQAGTWTLTVGVYQFGDDWFASGALLDRFAVGPVPLQEPAGWAVALVALAAAGTVTRRSSSRRER